MSKKTCEIKDIERDAGDTFPERINAWSMLDRDDIDITGYTFTLAVSSIKDWTPGDSSELFTVTGVHVSDSEGKVEFPIDTPDADIVGEMWYEIWMFDLNTKKRTIRKGRYTVA